MNTFNPQIDTSQLPQIENLVFQPLEKDYLTVIIVARAIFFAISVLMVAGFLFINHFNLDMWILYGIGGLYMFYILWSFLASVKGFKHKSYALRARDIVYKSGWLWKSTTTAPFNRVQHVMIDQGLIERQFNLAKLKVFTAGGSSSDLTIPGLNPITANMLKEFIVKKTGLDEEE